MQNTADLADVAGDIKAHINRQSQDLLGALEHLLTRYRDLEMCFENQQSEMRQMRLLMEDQAQLLLQLCNKDNQSD